MQAAPATTARLARCMSLFSTFVFLPLFLRCPFVEACTTTTFPECLCRNGIGITTTGATLFDDPERLNPLHLWRAAGWMVGIADVDRGLRHLGTAEPWRFRSDRAAEPRRKCGGGGGAHLTAARLAPVIALCCRSIRADLLLWVLLWCGRNALVAIAMRCRSWRRRAFRRLGGQGRRIGHHGRRS